MGRRLTLDISISHMPDYQKKEKRGIYMKAVIQRVCSAEVLTEGKQIGKIGKGLLILLGVGETDCRELVDKYIEKIKKLRIFEDENGKTNLSLTDVKGELLVVSQFTLYADCRRGNRPGFTSAAAPEMAESLYEYFLEKCREQGIKTESGKFGADMQVSLINDGPFTILLDDTVIH